MKIIETNNKYPNLEEAGEMIFKALKKAKENKNSVFFKVWNEWDREDGTPAYLTVEPDSDNWNFFFGDENAIDHPSFEGDGCVELTIETKEKKEITLWYSDSFEDWVFTANIDEYLKN